MLQFHIEQETRRDPRIPSDFGYTAHLLKATEDNKDDIVHEFDYSDIPLDIQNLNGKDFQIKVGDAKLYSEFPDIYTSDVTDDEKRAFVRDIRGRFGNLGEDPMPDNIYSLNYQYARALKKAPNDVVKVRSDIKKRADESQKALEKIEKIHQVVDDYREHVDLVNVVHRKFAEFVRTSPKVREFIDNGDIDGLNVFLHNSIRDKDIVGVMYNDLVATHSKEDILTVLHNNLPQFDALGNVSYISVLDKPVKISAERQEGNLREARSIRLMGKYKSITSELQKTPIGQHLLENSEVGQLLAKGGTPEEINSHIAEFYSTHPRFANKVNRGLFNLPKIKEDGSVVYKPKINPVNQKRMPLTEQEHIDEHIKRRQDIHTPTQKPLELGITPVTMKPIGMGLYIPEPIMTPTSEVAPTVQSAAQ